MTAPRQLTKEMEDKGEKRFPSIDEMHTKMLQNAVELGLDLDLLCEPEEIEKLGLRKQRPKEDQSAAQDNNKCSGAASNKEAMNESPKQIKESHEYGRSDSQQAGVEDRRTPPKEMTIQDLLDKNKSRRQQGDFEYLYDIRDDLASAQTFLKNDETKMNTIFPKPLGVSWLDWKLSESMKMSTSETDPLRQLLQPEHRSLRERRLQRIDPSSVGRAREIAGLQYGAQFPERSWGPGPSFPRERMPRRRVTGEEARVRGGEGEGWEKSLRQDHSNIQSRGFYPVEETLFEESRSREAGFRDHNYSHNPKELSRTEDSYSRHRDYKQDQAHNYQDHGYAKVYDKDYGIEIGIDNGEGEGLSGSSMADTSVEVISDEDVLEQENEDEIAYETTPESSGCTSPVEDVAEEASGEFQAGVPYRVDSYSRAVQSTTFSRQTSRRPPRSPDENYEDRPDLSDSEASGRSAFELDDTETASCHKEQEAERHPEVTVSPQKPPSSFLQYLKDLKSSATYIQYASGPEITNPSVQHDDLQKDYQHLEEQKNKDGEMVKLCNLFFSTVGPAQVYEDLRSPSFGTDKHAASGLDETENAVQHGEEQEDDQDLEGDMENIVEDKLSRLFITSKRLPPRKRPLPTLSTIQEEGDLSPPSSKVIKHCDSDLEDDGTAPQHGEPQEKDQHLEEEEENKIEKMQEACNLFFASATSSQQVTQSPLFQEVKDLPSLSSATNKHGACGLEEAETTLQHGELQEEHQHLAAEEENKDEEMEKLCNLFFATVGPSQVHKDLRSPSFARNKHAASGLYETETTVQHCEEKEDDQDLEGDIENKDED